MARYTGPKRKLSRREGVALFDKDLSFIERKGAVPPGVHGLKRVKQPSSYGLQLREKQKSKRFYGVFERQFRRYLKEASKKKEATGEILLQILERRLDNVLYRLGLSPSRMMGRQLVTHGHVQINGRKVAVPSYLVQKDDIITTSPKILNTTTVKKSLEEKTKDLVPNWLERKGGVGKVLHLPKREEIEVPINEQMIVEFYSR